MHPERIILIVIDGFGIGSLPDAALYGDEGSNTFQTLLDVGVKVDTLERLGLLAAAGQKCDEANVIGSYGKLMQKSCGKDTIVGHWELCGAITKKAFPTYPNGFPPELVAKLEKAFGREIIGNVAASGTEIIARLGNKHCEEGKPIVYTSADSVLQIAAHEDIVPIQQLYEFCSIAREIMQGEHGVGRVVARPFEGEKGNFRRTSNRKDFALPPPRNLLDELTEAGIPVHAIGKIENIFDSRGITTSVHTEGNTDGLDKLNQAIKENSEGLIFVNLVDTDMLYGHRRDAKGYARAIEEIDEAIGDLTNNLNSNDLLIITGDHGCDPGYKGSDHTREHTPVLTYMKGSQSCSDLGIRDSFADVSATILEAFGIHNPLDGQSFWPEMATQEVE